jgi:two-component system, OmpR family, sensor histidine kinase BaeS
VKGRLALASVVGGFLLAGLVLVASEAGMQARPDQRMTLYAVFAACVAVAGLGGWWLTHAHRRLPSLRWTVLVVSIAAVVVASGVVAASTSAMFLAPSDLRLVLAALLLGAGLGVLIAVSVTGPLTADLRQLAAAAVRVADGDLTVRTDVQRRDEVGEVARSLDRMVTQLDRLQRERQRGEAARRRLLTSIGHDLRTPLASLRAAIEALQDGVAPDPARYLVSMNGDVALLHSLVEDLFVLARLEAGELRLDRIPVDLAEVADSVVESVTPLAAQAQVRVHLDAAVPVPTTGDPQALERVMRNLVDNAIRHAPHGSVVQLGVGVDGGSAAVRVHDEGPGFPPEFVAHAFELFSRADAARERRSGGAGLGLAIARELVEAHGGTIRIEDGPGAALTFRVPLATS